MKKFLGGERSWWGGAVRRMCEGNEFLKMIDICELVHLAILLILSLLSYPPIRPTPTHRFINDLTRTVVHS